MVRNDIDDYYYSIGGGVHLGETSEQAVIREVFDETGVHYEVDHLAFVNECLFYGNGSLEGKEYMSWLPIDKLDEYKEFPVFLLLKTHQSR